MKSDCFIPLRFIVKYGQVRKNQCSIESLKKKIPDGMLSNLIRR